jgi:hypothetical protein
MVFWLHIDSNDIQKNKTDIYLLSLKNENHPNGIYFHPYNFRLSLSYFLARRLPKHSWMNSPDPYLAPKRIICEF